MRDTWVGCKTRRLRKRVFRTRVESICLPASVQHEVFKGNGLACVWHDIPGMLVLGGLMFGFSVARFRRLRG